VGVGGRTAHTGQLSSDSKSFSELKLKLVLPFLLLSKFRVFRYNWVLNHVSQPDRQLCLFLNPVGGGTDEVSEMSGNNY